MPRAIGALALVAMLLAMGCHFPGNSQSSDKPAAQTVARGLTPVIPANALIVESAILERPLGDPFLNHNLWTATLCTIPPETRELLASNGLQVGILTGNYPSEYLSIARNPAEVLGPPHRMTFNHIKEAVIPTAGPIANCRYELLGDLAGTRETITLTGANCGILVRPQRLADGRIKLWCEPQIQHGERVELFRPSEDGTQFTKCEEMPTEKYPALGFEVNLQPEDTLVIGSIAEERHALGSVLFEAESSGNPRQRVAAIRARVMNSTAISDLPTIALPGRRPTITSSGN